MKKFALLCTALVFCFVFIYHGVAAAKEQTTCPVMGGNIDKKINTDYKGKRVYFCCSMCIDIFKKDPEKYVKKMKEEGIELEKINISPEKKDDHSGHGH